MKIARKQWKITGFMALALFLLFSVCILGVLLTGADVYSRLVENDRAAYDRRTALQYLTTKVRQADTAESIQVVDFAGIPALQISEQIQGKTYLTRIYCQDGYIRELLAEESRDLAPEDGELVLEAEQLDFVWEPPLLTLQIRFADSTVRQSVLTVRSEQEAVP